MVQHFIFGLNVDVWKDYLPRESVSLGVCVSGCCGGVITGNLIFSGMVRIWVPKTRLGAMAWGEEEFVQQEELGRACIACYGVEARRWLWRILDHGCPADAWVDFCLATEKWDNKWK